MQKVETGSIALELDARDDEWIVPRRINLDANANAPVTSAVRAAVLDSLERSANPSSAHAGGDEARRILEDARDAVAGLCRGLFPEYVFFTSGCTEANNLIVASARARNATLITSAVEHPSILRPAGAMAAQGGNVVVLPVDADGQIRIGALEAALQAAAGPVVVSIQSANSETGVLQPIAEIAARVATRSDTLFHSDAAQAFGKSVLEVARERGPDVLSISGHKVHAPMGVGALLLREGEDRLRPLLLGGDQEGGLRAGTQPLPLIGGLAAACKERAMALTSDVLRMGNLRNRFENAVCRAFANVRINGGVAPRLPNTSNLQFSGLDAMSLLAHLDAEGVLCSQGSACHSRRPEPSPVLMAMGFTEKQAFASVRFSVSPLNTELEIDTAATIVINICHRLGLCE